MDLELASTISEMSPSPLGWGFPHLHHARAAGKMYGILIQSIIHHIKEKFGADTWLRVKQLANVQQSTFSTHERYSEVIIPNIAKATAEITGVGCDDLMDAFGVSFVTYVGQYGYDRILKVLGRHMSEFLNGLDNLHEYLRFSYAKIRPPSFFVENETSNGLTLHYRSKRKGFLHYVKGQIRQVGFLFYNIEVEIDIISVEESEHMVHVIYKLNFENTAYQTKVQLQTNLHNDMVIKSEVFFDLFPFHMVFNENMRVRSAGQAIQAVMSSILDEDITEVFQILLPLVHFSWNTILAHTNNSFELRSVHALSRRKAEADRIADRMSIKEKNEHLNQQKSFGDSLSIADDEDEDHHLHLKGQMMYMSDWGAIVFLGTPVMESLDTMFKTGLYINDLSMHDSSRDLVLAGTQQSAELKLALDQEQQKSKILEESMQRLDAEMRRTDQLLYQMIPKPVADRLRRGEPAINTCQVFESVTILFSDVVGFTRICSQISPMEVVSMLNDMYTKFDHLTEKHKVYKVETIGDAYMVVAGAPEKSPYHAMQICDMALDMAQCMDELSDPSKEGHMKIRVGIHSGNTVAGVVGIKMPRYCLFGDTVNTASRMETNSEANEIHISETTRVEIHDYPYIVEERGSIFIKGKGTMKTYWLLGREPESTASPMSCPFTSLVLEELSKVNEHEHTDKNCNSVDPLSRVTTPDSRALYSPVSYEDVRRTLGGRGSALGSPVPPPTTNNQTLKAQDAAGPDRCPSRNIDVDMIRNQFNKQVKAQPIPEAKVNNAERHLSQTCFIL